MIILDTNVLSEMMKAAPSPVVVHWMRSQPALELFTTAITRAEILYGIELLPRGKRRTRLEFEALAMFSEDFSGRVLPFDDGAAQTFAHLAVARRALGRPATQFDTQIAAIARAHGAALATRNTADFEGCGITVVNPWSGAFTRQFGLSRRPGGGGRG